MRIVQLVLFPFKRLLGACLRGGEEAQTTDDTAQKDMRLLTAEKAASLAYYLLASKLDDTYRDRLRLWTGMPSRYQGQHIWRVSGGWVFGSWYVYERTRVIEPASDVAKNIARDHFK